jgi:hypothetical protein
MRRTWRSTAWCAQVGKRTGMVEVLSGLNPGERVVTGNAQAVNNGDKISG